MTHIVAIASLLVMTACSIRYDEVLPVPIQGPLLDSGPRLDQAGRITGIATFRARVLVLRTESYRRDDAQDPMSEFSPADFAVAWGRAGLRAVREGVSVSQGRRRYGWEGSCRDASCADMRSFGLVSANWHIVPADAAVADAVEDVSKGDVVEIEGDLVSIVLKGGVVVRSSVTRDDVEDGACEIIRVRSVRIV
jgi:hypothetical protein